MKSEKANRKIDAVAMMRQIRDGLSKKYLEDPSAEDKDLAQIRKMYGIRINEKA